MEAAQRYEFGKYAMVAEIARGGMGIVYLAQVEGPGGFKKSVVVKVLKPELAEDASFREMFLEEASLAARLNHRNIVQTNEVGHDGGQYFLAMDYLEGTSLHRAQKRLKGAAKLPLGLELRVVSEVLAGLHYAHELNDYDGTPLGVVHRDVGPQNIFLTYDGQVKLIDFGVAKMENRRQETAAGVLKGRVAYMAPEQAGGDKIDRRVDIFAAGVLLRELVTGARLWEGLSEMDTLRRLLGRDLPPFPDDVSIPSELRAICERAMASDPEHRFQTAHDMRVVLEQYVARTDPTGTLADLGVHLAREFQSERKRVKDVVDSNLAGGPASSLPRVGKLVSSSRDVSGVTGPSSSRRALHVEAGPASGTVVSAEVPDIEVHIDGDPAAARSSRQRRALVYAGAAAVVVGALLFVMLRRGGATEQPIADTRGVAPPSAVAAPPVAPATTTDSPGGAAPADHRTDTVEIFVRVTPPGAHIFIDDAPVEGNPYRAHFPRNSAAMHSVRAVAPGFLAKSELVKFDENASLSMSLERQLGPAPAPRPPEVRIVAAPVPAAAPPPAPKPAPPPADINPRGGRAPKRDIDQKNPYGVE